MSGDSESNGIPLWELVLLVVAFGVLYNWVIPKLFPSVVQGGLVVDPNVIHRKMSGYKKHDDSGEGHSQQQHQQQAQAPLESFVVSGGSIGFATGHRTQAKAQLRRRQVEEQKAYMV